MKKVAAILLAATLFIIFDQTYNRLRPAVISEAEPPLPAESAPQKPTSTDAAVHNAAINPGDIHLIQFEEPDEGDHIAVLETSRGEIRIRLFAEHAPETVKTFEKLIASGHYNGQPFHTTINGYKIEGGGRDDVREFSGDEFSLDLWNFRGAVALADNGSDFLIVQAGYCLNPISELEDLNFPSAVIEKYEEVGGAPHQDWKNTVFGQVISGMDTVDGIAAERLTDTGEPEEPVIIANARVEVHTLPS